MNRRPKKMNLQEIKKMEKVCQLAADCLQKAGKLVKPGITTEDINSFVVDYAKSAGVRNAPLNYHGFPKSVCTSVNDVVCHGVPRIDEVLKSGDCINIDVTFELEGFHGDTSRTFFVGEVSETAKRLAQCAEEAMMAGIAAVKAGKRTGDVGHATNLVVRKYGYHAVRDIGGHGIGQAFHLDPFVPAVGRPRQGDRLLENTCITVEPMINENSHLYETFTIPNSDITYFRTLDGSLSAQFEHTVLITKDGPRILTQA